MYNRKGVVRRRFDNKNGPPTLVWHLSGRDLDGKTVSMFVTGLEPEFKVEATHWRTRQEKVTTNGVTKVEDVPVAVDWSEDNAIAYVEYLDSAIREHFVVQNNEKKRLNQMRDQQDRERLDGTPHVYRDTPIVFLDPDRSKWFSHEIDSNEFKGPTRVLNIRVHDSKFVRLVRAYARFPNGREVSRDGRDFEVPAVYPLHNKTRAQLIQKTGRRKFAMDIPEIPASGEFKVYDVEGDILLYEMIKYGLKASHWLQYDLKHATRLAGKDLITNSASQYTIDIRHLALSPAAIQNILPRIDVWSYDIETDPGRGPLDTDMSSFSAPEYAQVFTICVTILPDIAKVRPPGYHEPMLTDTDGTKIKFWSKLPGLKRIAYQLGEAAEFTEEDKRNNVHRDWDNMVVKTFDCAGTAIHADLSAILAKELANPHTVETLAEGLKAAKAAIAWVQSIDRGASASDANRVDIWITRLTDMVAMIESGTTDYRELDHVCIKAHYVLEAFCSEKFRKRLSIFSSLAPDELAGLVARCAAWFEAVNAMRKCYHRLFGTQELPAMVSEGLMLTTYHRDFMAEDCDVVMGYNQATFDQWYYQERSNVLVKVFDGFDHYGDALSAESRAYLKKLRTALVRVKYWDRTLKNAVVPRNDSFQSSATGAMDNKVYNLDERHMFDMLVYLRKNVPTMGSHKLAAVAKTMGMGKIDCPYAMIPFLQKTPDGRRALIDYCMRDSGLPVYKAVDMGVMLSMLEVSRAHNCLIDPLFHKGQTVLLRSLLNDFGKNPASRPTRGEADDALATLKAARAHVEDLSELEPTRADVVRLLDEGKLYMCMTSGKVGTRFYRPRDLQLCEKSAEDIRTLARNEREKEYFARRNPADPPPPFRDKPISDKQVERMIREGRLYVDPREYPGVRTEAAEAAAEQARARSNNALMANWRQAVKNEEIWQMARDHVRRKGVHLDDRIAEIAEEKGIDMKAFVTAKAVFDRYTHAELHMRYIFLWEDPMDMTYPGAIVFHVTPGLFYEEDGLIPFNIDFNSLYPFTCMTINSCPCCTIHDMRYARRYAYAVLTDYADIPDADHALRQGLELERDYTQIMDTAVTTDTDEDWDTDPKNPLRANWNSVKRVATPGNPYMVMEHVRMGLVSRSMIVQSDLRSYNKKMRNKATTAYLDDKEATMPTLRGSRAMCDMMYKLKAALEVSLSMEDIWELYLKGVYDAPTHSKFAALQPILAGWRAEEAAHLAAVGGSLEALYAYSSKEVANVKLASEGTYDWMLYEMRQRANKIAANSMYGTLKKNMRGVWSAIGITKTSRWELCMAAWVLVKIHDLELIAGDTDSVFGVAKGKTREEVQDIANRLAADVNDMLNRMVARIHRIPLSHVKLNIEYEKMMPAFINVIRKHYAGYYTLEANAKLSFLCKGMVNKRRDYPPYIARVVDRLLEIILKERDPEKAQIYIGQVIGDLKNDRVSISDLTVYSPIKKSFYDYTHTPEGKPKPGTSVIQWIMHMNETSHRDNPYAAGDRVPWVLINVDKKNKGQKVQFALPEDAIEYELPIHTNHYIDMLVRVFRGLLPVVDDYVSKKKGVSTKTKLEQSYIDEFFVQQKAQKAADAEKEPAELENDAYMVDDDDNVFFMNGSDEDDIAETAPDLVTMNATSAKAPTKSAKRKAADTESTGSKRPRPTKVAAVRTVAAKKRQRIEEEASNRASFDRAVRDSTRSVTYTYSAKKRKIIDHGTGGTEVQQTGGMLAYLDIGARLACRNIRCGEHVEPGVPFCPAHTGMLPQHVAKIVPDILAQVAAAGKNASRYYKYSHSTTYEDPTCGIADYDGWPDIHLNRKLVGRIIALDSAVVEAEWQRMKEPGGLVLADPAVVLPAGRTAWLAKKRGNTTL